MDALCLKQSGECIDGYSGNPPALAVWSVKTAADWISVKDALPERVGVYLCQCNKWGDFVLQILYFYPDTGHFKKRIGGADMTANVTHWMELPEEAKNGQGQT